MKRVHQSLLWAALGAATVGVAIYFVVNAPSGAERQRAELERKRVFRFGTNQVFEAHVQTKEGSLRIRRDPVYGWMLHAPYRWPGDPEAILALLGRVSSLRGERTVTEDPTERELKTFGFGERMLQIEVRLADARWRGLRLGGVNPLSDLVYAQISARPSSDRAERVTFDGPVFLARTDPLWALERPLSEFRSKRIFPVDRDGLESLSKHRKGVHRWTLKTSDGGVVSSDGRAFGPADPKTASRALGAALLRLEATRFLVDHVPTFVQAAAALGAALHPQFVMTIRHRDGLVQSATVALVKEDVVRPVAFTHESLVELYPPPVEELADLEVEDLSTSPSVTSTD
ncbi:MAG: DUF4340 domain-containing protein [Myxococcota bacterium]